MRIVFMGTSEFAVPSLNKLHSSGFSIEAVITQPDRPRGRGRRLAYSAVKEQAMHLGLTVLQPLKVRLPESVEMLQEIGPDLIVVASYGQLIPPVILHMPRYGCINVHSSLLPAYRGAAPIHRAIMNGERETGVTIMLMDESLDTGDMLAQVRMEIGETEDSGSLEARLAQKGAELLVPTIESWVQGSIQAIKQDESRSTYAAMLKSSEETIDWTREAREIGNQIRALSPQPGAYTLWEGRRLKLFSPLIPEFGDCPEAVPGQLVEVSRGPLCGQGWNRLPVCL